MAQVPNFMVALVVLVDLDLDVLAIYRQLAISAINQPKTARFTAKVI